MLEKLRDFTFVKRLQKNRTYFRLRQRLPMRRVGYIDNGEQVADSEAVVIDWPSGIPKPRVGIVRDLGAFPRWTQYRRFLEHNGFTYDFYDLHTHDWIEKAGQFDAVVGLVSNEHSYLDEIREKYHFLETYLGKKCYPSPAHALLYENKSLESFISTAGGLPFAPTAISHQEEDALSLASRLKYPVVSKVASSSGSMGVELVRSPEQAGKIIKRAFSRNGRKIHFLHARQKNYVYFQEFIPNDGYDIRVMIVDRWGFGYFRKVPAGDFRASGMNLVEKRDLPREAVLEAWKANRYIQVPLLIVDMVRGLDGRYWIVEFSPFCRMETPEQLMVDGVPGHYRIDEDGSILFEKGRHWVNELALKKFLSDTYLPSKR